MESIRTCLACRRKASKNELCRFVRAPDGEICYDEKGAFPHRGAWVCAKKSCLMKGFQKRLLFRGEKSLPINTDDMLCFIQSRIKKSLLARLGLMRRCGQIEMGNDAVRKMIEEKRAFAVICAKDFSKRSFGKINEAVIKIKKGVMMESPFLMDEVGRSLGRVKTGVVALEEGRITDEILLQLHKLKELEL